MAPNKRRKKIANSNLRYDLAAGKTPNTQCLISCVYEMNNLFYITKYLERTFGESCKAMRYVQTDFHLVVMFSFFLQRIQFSRKYSNKGQLPIQENSRAVYSGDTKKTWHVSLTLHCNITTTTFSKTTKKKQPETM